MWQGTLSDDQKYLTWDALDLEPTKSRIRPICFKLKDTLYIGGGKTMKRTKDVDESFDALYKPFTCCDTYNLQEGTYHQSVYFLPWLIYEVHNVFTDADETFAIITQKHNTRLLVFTEKDGFKALSNVNIDILNDLSYHLSIVLRIK